MSDCKFYKAIHSSFALTVLTLHLLGRHDHETIHAGTCFVTKLYKGGGGGRMGFGSQRALHFIKKINCISINHKYTNLYLITRFILKNLSPQNA